METVHRMMTMSGPPSGGTKEHICIVNVGLYRSGTTTLTEAAKKLGLKVYRKFPDLSPKEMKTLLLEPEATVADWFDTRDGLQQIISMAKKNDFICDGWIALIPFLGASALRRLESEAAIAGVHLKFVATQRNIQETVQSELQHWTVHNLERKTGLFDDAMDRSRLEESLRTRATQHQRQMNVLQASGHIRLLLPLEEIQSRVWPETLSSISSYSVLDWSKAITEMGKCNANPLLPIEGILLTMRIGKGTEAEEKIASVARLLDQIEQDSLCRYLLVLGIDEDEESSSGANQLVAYVQSRIGDQMLSMHLIINPRTTHHEPFPICSIWDCMSKVAWENGADWVVLLGDDVDIQCSFHYRAFYRAFLDIQERIQNVPFGFGCPWWNDTSFPGFPSFPCVGKSHFDIFGGLIPEPRRGMFINQDLDPYLHRLYSKFGAAPRVDDARLTNTAGGAIGANQGPRYERIAAKGWKDCVEDDIESIRQKYPDIPRDTEMILLDVVVPSYRVRLDYLESICSLRVPKNIQTLFIIIIDNPDALLHRTADLSNRSADTMTLAEGERILEEHLSQFGNQIRVRCNEINVGASASRNRGLDESAAEFVLNLDDDLIPNPDLLEQHGRKLESLLQEEVDIVGLIGLVRFPRSPELPLRHAAVLMSYLTFMFEIAERNAGLYPNPAWGVTAHILFRRTTVRFDLAYAKTGGGEDVDFSLRVAAEAGDTAKLVAVPAACVVHPFWPGSVLDLASHFFNWAIGDGSLLARFPEFRYWSFPNFPETMMFLSPLAYWLGPLPLITLILQFLIADIAVDMSNREDYRHRCGLLEPLHLEDSEKRKWKRNPFFYFASHALANGYVVVLECGRLWGHLQRPKPWRYDCRRFDWHCGRLERAPHNFRRREACKFGLFVGMATMQLVVGWSNILPLLWEPLRDDGLVRSSLFGKIISSSGMADS